MAKRAPHRFCQDMHFGFAKEPTDAVRPEVHGKTPFVPMHGPNRMTLIWMTPCRANQKGFLRLRVSKKTSTAEQGL